MEEGAGDWEHGNAIEFEDSCGGAFRGGSWHVKNFSRIENRD